MAALASSLALGACTASPELEGEIDDSDAAAKGATVLTPAALGYRRMGPDREHGAQIRSDENGTVSYFDSGWIRTWQTVDSSSAGLEEAGTRAEAQGRVTTEAVLRRAALRSPDELVDLEVMLPEVPLDFEGLGAESETARLAVVDERVAELAPAQDAIEAAVTALGGEVVARRWLTNSLRVRVPAHAVPALASEPRIAALEPSIERIEPAYFGYDVRDDIMPAYDTLGFLGETGGRSTSISNNIKIGIIDVGGINSDHVAFRDSAGGASRVRRVFYCATGTCVNQQLPTSIAHYDPSVTTSHAMAVTGAAIADLLQGQDPAYSSTNAEARTFLGREMEALVFLLRDWDVIPAIEEAVIVGADVINMSFGLGCSTQCEWRASCGGASSAIRNALLAGVVSVASAGNSQEPPNAYGCNALYPATNFNTISVGGLDTTFTGTSIYSYTLRHDQSSVGPVVNANSNAYYPGVDLMAPFEIKSVPKNDVDSGSGAYISFNGTSAAAPIVASAIGLLREGLRDFGLLTNVTDGRPLMINALLMGDGMGAANVSGVRNDTGYGRIRAHIPFAPDLVAPYGWGWRSVTLGLGEEVIFSVGPSDAELSTVNGWKWAVMLDDDFALKTPNFTIHAEDWCPPGGGS